MKKEFDTIPKVNVVDYSCWQEMVTVQVSKGKYGKKPAWVGQIIVGGGVDQIEEKVQAFYKEYKRAFADAEAKEETLSRETINSLQNWMSSELKAIYAAAEKPKKLDMVKIATKLGIEVGSPGWDKQTVEAVKQDKHLGETND